MSHVSSKELKIIPHYSWLSLTYAFLTVLWKKNQIVSGREGEEACPGMLTLRINFVCLCLICEMMAVYLDPLLCTSVEDDISNSHRDGSGLL